MGIGLVGVGASVYVSMPKGWDKKAITATFVSSEFSHASSPSAYYRYTLTNNTSHDYSTKLSQGEGLRPGLRLAIMRGPIHDGNASTEDDSFKPSLSFGAVDIYLATTETIDQFMKNQSDDNPIFIPSGQKVDIRLRWEFPSDEIKAHTSANIVNSSLYGFVLYDETSHSEIDFPKPALIKATTTGADSKKETEKPIAPDHTDAPWDFYRACGEAARVVPLCAQSGFKPKNGEWIDVPLPRMVLPPSGYHLQPDANSCEIAFQWKIYCDRKK